MVKNAYTSFNSKSTPQSEPIPNSTQVANSAGGFSWKVGKWDQLERFLILGSEEGTYYISEKKLTKDNAVNVLDCIKTDGPRTVATIVSVSVTGRAPKNDPAIFALALCFAFGDAETKATAQAALPNVCRIGTHLFHFAQYVEQFRGWGRVLKTAVRDWYDNKTEQALAYEVTKYQSRDGWSHRDLIRLSHPKRNSVVYDYAVHGNVPSSVEYIGAVENLKREGVVSEKPTPSGLDLITKYNLPREVVPTQWLNYPETWEALLPRMGLEAMVRNLGNMSKVGLLAPLSDASKIVVEKLSSGEEIRRSRLHPLKILIGNKQYSEGRGFKGSNTWTPVPQVVEALDSAFYLAFDNVEPSNKRVLLALDASGSMESPIPGTSLRCCEGAAAMAMVTARTEPNYYVMGFSNKFRDLKITANDTLESATKKTRDNNFGSTDAAVAMQWAMDNNISVDAFVVYTDNETWAGVKHPSQALKQYRKAMDIPHSKLVVVAMTSNGFSIADPNDRGMLDVVGFDTAVPAVIGDFIRG